jgi:hypothetical protein
MTLWLFAQPGRMDELVRQMADGFREKPAEVNWSGMLVGLAAATAVLMVWWVAARWLPEGHRRPAGGPRRLFFTLCRAHGLTWREYWLVWRVARRQKLDQPAKLFLEPERWRPERLEGFEPNHLASLRRLQDRLFAGM